jgi:hypothetical protein
MMDKEEKIQFINDLIEAVRSKIITKIEAGSIPEEWDGIELRWFLRDIYSAQCGSGSFTRRRNYNNTILINNLL